MRQSLGLLHCNKRLRYKRFLSQNERIFNVYTSFHDVYDVGLLHLCMVTTTSAQVHMLPVLDWLVK